jgi:hypothetical protein
MWLLIKHEIVVLPFAITVSSQWKRVGMRKKSKSVECGGTKKEPQNVNRKRENRLLFSSSGALLEYSMLVAVFPLVLSTSSLLLSMGVQRDAIISKLKALL